MKSSSVLGVVFAVCAAFVVQTNGMTWVNIGDWDYGYSNNVHTFDHAVEECQEVGAALVTIHSQAENTYITDNLIYNDMIRRTSFWIGLSSIDADKTVFAWSDNSTLTFSSFDTGEPKAVQGKRACVYMKSGAEVQQTGKWASQSCKFSRRYVCKRSAVIP